MDENEWAEFFFDSDVYLAMMRGKTYEEAVEEAKQNLRDEREWRGLGLKKLDAAAQ